MAGALSLKLLTYFTFFSLLFFFFFFFPCSSSVCAAFPCPPQGTQGVGKRKISSPGSSVILWGKFQEIGSIHQLRDDTFASLTQVGTRLFLPEQNVSLFLHRKIKKTPCIWKSGGFSLHGIMLFPLLLFFRYAGYPSLLPRELVDASLLEVSFGQMFVCPSCWILCLGGILLCFSPVLPKSCFFFQIAHKAASSSWWEDKEPALFLAILGREAVKLGYLRAENRWFTAEQLHGNQWEVVLENVAYCSERLLGRVLQPASSDSDSFLQTLYWVTISTGHPNLSLLPRAEFLSSLLHKHTGQALGSGPKHFYTVYPFLMIMQQPFNLQIHHWCPPPTRPPGDLSLLLCPHQHLLLSSQYFQADHWE